MAESETRDRETSSDALMAVFSESGDSQPLDSRRPVRAAPDLPPPRSHGWYVFFGITAALIWTAGTIAYLVAYAGIDVLDPLARHSPAQLAGLAIFALGPAILFIMAALIIRELRQTVDRTRGVQAALARLAAPAEVAEAEVRSLSGAISGEIDRINSSLESALARLAAMEEVIRHHADTLEQSAGDARQRAEDLLQTLRGERERLQHVSDSMDDKAALIATAISEQSRMIAAAAELAGETATDAERRVRDSADALAGAGQAIADSAQSAAGKVDARVAELRDLSGQLENRTEQLEDAYKRHKTRLGEAGESLREEQEKIAAALDFHRAELEIMSKTAREGADALNDAAKQGAGTFSDTVEAALVRARRMAADVHAEADKASEAHRKALEDLQAASDNARKASQAAGEALEEQSRLVAARIEDINEKSFDAARKADESFAARLKEAEKLTSRAALAADEAAESVKRRLETVLTAARDESAAIEREIEKLADKLAELPASAQLRAKEASDALRNGLEGLNAAALAAAEEAQEIDAAFQARIRQNYELLSDFMLKMGSVAGGRRALDLPANEVPNPLSGKKKAETGGEAAGGEAPKRDTIAFPERGRSNEPGWRWKDLLSSMPDSDERRRDRDDEAD
ncbi:hypothetical protein [Hyphobacterium sp.]|jgi:uncharacterized phage infection (PIP) family protein YhgE|uniref:hypothetical protein n=1 Tax=Hyphobacterium sp. TaxID=2004662 RepID=UPI003BAABDD3